MTYFAKWTIKKILETVWTEVLDFLSGVRTFTFHDEEGFNLEPTLWEKRVPWCDGYISVWQHKGIWYRLISYQPTFKPRSYRLRVKAKKLPDVIVRNGLIDLLTERV